MERKLYYSIDKEIEDGQFVTGNKTIDVYEVQNNSLEHLFDLELELSDNSENEIRNYIDDNWDDELIENETFVFVRL